MAFLRNTWYVAALSNEIEQKPLVRTLLGEPVMLFRGEDGLPKAMHNLCPHRFASLSDGKRDGDVVECPYHGLRFNTAGVCVHNPHGDGRIPQKARVNVYPLVERYNYIWIWMGEAAADPASIPDFEIMARDDYAYFDGYLTVEANYQLVVDNLLDLSHIQFLHPFLSSPEWVAKSSGEVYIDKGDVWGISRASDISVFPVWRLVRPSVPERGEQWMDVRWSAPSHVYIDIRFRTPDLELRAPNGHFMTPIDEQHTHYFYRIGRNEAVDSPEVHLKLSAKVADAFGKEDEPMLEQQQRNIGPVDLLDMRPLILKSDATAINARRLLKQKIAQELAPVAPLAPRLVTEEAAAYLTA